MKIGAGGQTGDALAQRLDATLDEIGQSAADRASDVAARLAELEREKAVLKSVATRVDAAQGTR
jgi:hypothetical protein